MKKPIEGKRYPWSGELEVRPCPGCGSSKSLQRNTELVHLKDGVSWNMVMCHHCHFKGPLRAAIEDAIDAWNRRASDAEIQRLETMLDRACCEIAELEFCPTAKGYCSECKHWVSISGSGLPPYCSFEDNADAVKAYLADEANWKE